MILTVFRKKRSMFAGLVMAFLLLLFTGFASASSGGGHGESAVAKGWASTDTQRVMNFAVLAVLLVVLLRKPVSGALNGRIDDIKSQLDTLEKEKVEAKKLLSGYEEKIARLEGEASKIISQYKEQGEAVKARILQEAEASAEKLEAQAKRNIEQEFKHAKQQLQAEIMEKALEKAEELIKKSIEAEDQERLVDEYLEKVVA